MAMETAMKMKKKILILGANGFTGRRTLQRLVRSGQWEVTGSSLHNDRCPDSGPYRFLQTDLCRDGDVQQLMEEVRPDVVVNTSALSVPDYCETHRSEADLMNTQAVKRLAQLCRLHGSRLIHLSTDFVFSGKQERLYTEDDLPAPVNYYGLSKWNGEKAVETHCSDYAIVRVEVVYGKALPGQHGNIVQLVADRLRQSLDIRVVSDQWRTPTYVDDIAWGVERLASHPSSGIYHLAGSDCLSIAEMAARVAAHLRLDTSHLHAVSTAQMGESTPRPRFSGLSIAKACRELGYRPHTFDEGIRALFDAGE